MKTKAGAISSGCAARPIAVPAPNFATSWGGRSAGLSGVQTGARQVAAVAVGNSFRVVGLGDGVSLDDLVPGDEVLLGKDHSREFAGISAGARADVVAILKDTRPDLAPFFTTAP